MIKEAFKSVFYLVLILSNSALISAQNWVGIGGGMDKAVGCFYNDSSANLLYYSGSFKFYNDTVYTVGVAAFDGTDVLPLGCGVDWDCVTPLTPGALIFGINKILKYNGEIIGGGIFEKADNKPARNISKWNGLTWDSLGHGVNTSVTALHVNNNNLYVGGAFDSAGYISANGLAMWNGQEWADVGNFPNNHCCNDINFVRSIQFFNNELYVAGKISDSLENPIRIVRYDGTSWKGVGNGFSGSIATVNDMEIFQGDLYVAGMYKKSDGNPESSIARWDGEQWHTVGGGVTSEDDGYSQIFDLQIFNNELYAVGFFDFAGGVPAKNIAKWDGQQWCGFGSQFDNTIFSLGVFNDELYIGGGFWTIDGDSILRIAKWIGGNYTDTCGAIIGLEENNIQTFELEIYPNPATNLLTIKTTAVGKAEYFIYDINGRKLDQWSMVNGQFVIDVSTFAEGLYLLQIQTEQGSINRKFVKRK